MTLLYLRNYNYIELALVFGCKENAAVDTVTRVLGAIRVPLLEAPFQPLKKHPQLAKGKFHDLNIGRGQVSSIPTGCIDCQLYLPNKQSDRA
jgi:hypothetical protein